MGLAKSPTAEAARRDLAAWTASFPADPFGADAPLRRILADRLPAERLAALADRADRFGRAVVAEVAPAVRRCEQRGNLPEPTRWDAIGRQVEGVDFDPAYHSAGVAVWSSGLVALSAEPGRAFEQATLLYLLSLEGEAGHACPATCTIGEARALRRVADVPVRDRFLPVLLETEYGLAQRGAQFLTEIQGGSDVGANVCAAEPVGDGTFLTHGEKWFCSVADADQFLLTARVPDRPPGTRGLGCFVVPRLVDGEPNGFALRRLKDKLGTRALASGEIDFDGALAWPIGPIEDGFRTAVGVVLNTSRWLTAVGATGMMRRAVLDATSYAEHRRAFGQPISAFPAVRTTLAGMKARWLGALHVCFELTELEDRIDIGIASDADRLLHRFLVNAVKYATSTAATGVVRDGIEVLGGNGTIEDFSVLPRLYRDAIVYESWEGTHNVLVAQVLNDLRRFPILDAVEARATELATSGPAGLGAVLDETLTGLRRAVTDPHFGAWHARALLERVVLVFEVGLLAGHDDAAAEFLYRDRLDRGYVAVDDPGFAGRVAAVLAG